MNQNKLYTVFFILMAFSISEVKAQDKEIEKPALVYIVDGQEVSEAAIEELAKNNQIKAMRNGISKKEKREIIKKFKERIQTSFIASIDTYSDEEMVVRTKKLTSQKQEEKSEKVIEKSKIKPTLITVGDVPSNFVIEGLNGDKLELADFKGKVVLLNFWATWCVPCIREFYEMPDKILNPNKNKDFVFIPVSVGENRGVVSKKMKELNERGLDFPVYLDPKKELFANYEKGGIPLNYVLDREGKIVAVSIGYNEKRLNELAKKIKALLQ